MAKLILIFIFAFFSSTPLFAGQEFSCKDSEKKISIVGSIGTGDTLVGPVYVYNYALEESYQLSEFNVSHFWVNHVKGELRLKSYDMMEDKSHVVLIVDKREGTLSLDYKVVRGPEASVEELPIEVKIEQLEVTCDF